MKSRLRNGFTLIELLVVVSIIVILIAILVPAIERAMDAAREMRCLANLDATGIATRMYLNDNKSIYYPHRWGNSSNGAGAPDERWWGQDLVEPGYLTRLVLQCSSLGEDITRNDWGVSWKWDFTIHRIGYGVNAHYVFRYPYRPSIPSSQVMSPSNLMIMGDATPAPWTLPFNDGTSIYGPWTGSLWVGWALVPNHYEGITGKRHRSGGGVLRADGSALMMLETEINATNGQLWGHPNIKKYWDPTMVGTWGWDRY